MGRSLPSAPDIRHLRKEAKALLKAARGGDPEALSLLSGLPDDARKDGAQSPEREPSLQRMQHALALDYGFKSWAELSRAVERDAPVDEAAADSDRKRVHYVGAFHLDALTRAERSSRELPPPDHRWKFETDCPGVLDVCVTWPGTAGPLATILNGPGQVGYYARYDQPNPIHFTFDVTEDLLSKGEGWRISVTNWNEGLAEGVVSIRYLSASGGLRLPREDAEPLTAKSAEGPSQEEHEAHLNFGAHIRNVENAGEPANTATLDLGGKDWPAYMFMARTRHGQLSRFFVNELGHELMMTYRTMDVDHDRWEGMVSTLSSEARVLVGHGFCLKSGKVTPHLEHADFCWTRDRNLNPILEPLNGCRIDRCVVSAAAE